MAKNEDGNREVPVHVNTFIAMGIVALMVLGAAVFVTISANRETQALGKCLVEQMTEHRNDNRNSHEAMSKEHFILNPEFEDRSVEGLPDPPVRLPRPKNRKDLLDSCAKYLENIPKYESDYEK